VYKRQGGRRDGRTEEEEEEEEGGADTALKTKTPHVNVGNNKQKKQNPPSTLNR
jgi:hypothetical protein